MIPIEKQLINSIKEGDQKSFELVFKTYYTRLCTFAFGYTKQMETAEDLVKDVFVHIWNNRKKIEIKTSVSAYFFRSVRNACINYLERDKNRKHLLSLDELKQQEIKVAEPLSTDYPISKILASELEDRIQQEIEKLPDSCREVFKLSRFEDLSHKQIAEKLNISENTVKVQIYRALSKIKDALESGSMLFFQLFLKK